ncbi:hypothetical protein NC661_13685 [Aquibacillus koreensis]|uniref:DUF7878 domain-containing protein n=1 Tax=Aquibacillus koreensis TaxID=279446 RepID=A0A9X3WMC2_9BACI|nr:hypothetical protein [Aquibacillus koreensis]MCT2536820.1 hypothetical protein [Aquibacillus koreensis]MDC3421423.1 hypothetical protein [Aquibacillus koreensis]
MDNIPSKIEFSYHFTSNEADIPKKLKKEPSIAFRIEGDFEITINGVSYFQENLTLLEFYLYLHRWFNHINKKGLQAFYYYSMEWDKDEPIISIIPYNNKAQITSIWRKTEMYTVFDLSYILSELESLENKLGQDIEKHYDLSLNTFIGKVPLRKIKD